MMFKYLLLIILLMNYSEAHVIQKMETGKTSAVLPIPENEFTSIGKIPEKLKIFMDKLDQGLQRLKNVLNASVYETVKKELDFRSEEPLESYLTQHQIFMHNDIKELQTDTKGRTKRRASSPVLITASKYRPEYEFRPTDCSDLRVAGVKTSGVYPIYPFTCRSDSRPVNVYCDMETNEGGWTVFLARMKTSEQISFNRSFRDYGIGFGSADKEYWLGNKILNKLTRNRNYVLRMEADDGGLRRTWGEWRTFKVDTGNNEYNLTVENYNPNSAAQDRSLSYHNGQKFTTYDRDNDKNENGNCAESFKGGWWYKDCYNINPTGIYGEKSDSGIKIYRWDKFNSAALYPVWLQLKIRPEICADF